MSKRQFKSQASSSRVDSSAGFSGFGSVFAGSILSYLSEPPSLSSITDANVVVAFKNLLKKDSTTKAKGLEDLRSYVQSHPYEQNGGVEQPILEAWVKLYPRLSIDNSRRVRELSHVLQFELLKSARKRMERHIPSIVGAWLSGTYDRDRPVARAANDGITSFLDTEEKVLAFWRRCQPEILTCAQEAFKETPQTLSDERNMSSDDVQAKYDRVIGASMSLVINLLIKLDDNHIQKHQESYTTFLSGNKILWGFIASNDAFLRRTVAQLLSVCLDKQSQVIAEDLEVISHAFISEGLRSPQNGSSLQFLQALHRLTQKFPAVWSTAYKGRKASLGRLRQFIEKGSQGGPSEYWEVLASLNKTLPTGILPTDLDGVVEFLKAYRHGMASREEARMNLAAAWASYFEVLKQLRSSLVDLDDSVQVLSAAVFPIFDQFLQPAPEHYSWSVGNNVDVLAKAFSICYLSGNSPHHEYLEKEWSRLALLIITDILASLPQQSKDYVKSQDIVVAEGRRWFILHAEIIRSPELADSMDQIIKFLGNTCSSVIAKALDIISTRYGKPYGAAGTLEAALRKTPKLITTVSSTQDAIAHFLYNEFPKLLTSPSSEYLIASMYAFGMLPDQEEPLKEIWKIAAHELVATPDIPQKNKGIKNLISNLKISPLAQEDSFLQEYLHGYISELIQGQLEDWSLYESALTFDSLSNETASSIMSIIIHSLGNRKKALRALESVCQKRPQLLRVEEGTYLAIMTNLLLLLESPDPSTVSRTNALKAIVEKADTATSHSGHSSFLILDIIQENLENVGPQSLSVNTLVQQAETFLNSERSILLDPILPDPVQWSKALLSILEIIPNPELSLTNALGSAISLVQASVPEKLFQPPRDFNGFSGAFRMALYTSKLLSKWAQKGLPLNDAVMILRLLIMSYSAADDQSALAAENQLWIDTMDTEVQGQVSDFLYSERIILQAIFDDAKSWRDSEPGNPSTITAQILVKSLIEASEGTSPAAFYAARALNSVISKLVTTHGWKNLGGDEWLSSLGILKASTRNVFAAVAVISGLQEFLASSQFITNLCNHLVSDVTVASARGENTLKLFVLLNATLAIFEPSNLPVAQNRIVFAVKHITSWLSEDQRLPPLLAAEVCRSLQFLLPSIKDIYGPYWETSIKFCINQWKIKSAEKNFNERLALYSASLRLVTLLKGLSDPNDDLSEALLDSAKSISDGLLGLLKVPRTNDSSPWASFQNHLWRQTLDIPVNHIDDSALVYPLVASESFLIQSAAFSILNRVIPAAQEQVSIDVVLEKKDAQLPEELLSLLLDAPSFENFADEDLAKFPSQIRSYLYSWELVFASYPKASFKVRNDYSEALKSGNYILPLFDFLFDLLGHSAGKPLNLDKSTFTPEQIRFYDDLSAHSDGEERNMQWLLINLYYLCLKFAPGLAKTWWMNCKSKQTRVAVESWTEKYFSPLVIADTMDEVATWSSQQQPELEDEKELIVKVSKNSREVYAGCEIDDMQMQIVIRLPATYPLEGVKVDGINRVAVSEKKWQSWLMITQGVITFSNGSIIDGLTTFRHNITGALKGQTECAICYSIISSDKKMPEKRCQTCKNLFHSSCLFKWFASSNQSTCPLCRNIFNYGTDVASRMRRRAGPE